jgi:hypothetical protein
MGIKYWPNFVLMNIMLSSMFRKLSIFGKIIYWCFFLKKIVSSRVYITCGGKTDGAGAQALAMLSVQLFAQACGFQYIHTPFTLIEHNHFNDPNWENEWESFFNLGLGEISFHQIDWTQFEVVRLSDIAGIPCSPHQKTIYTIHHAHDYANLFPNAYQKITNAISARYVANSKQRYSIYKYDKLNIALHIRRGDIGKSGNASNRYTSNTSVIQMVQNLIENLRINGVTENTIVFHVFSQGDANDFSDILEEFRNLEMYFHLDSSPFESFNGLVESDILVMSKSTFSYLAALLCGGVKIYDNFYHPPLKNWVKWSKNYNLSRKEFQESLKFLILRKSILNYHDG